MSDYQPVFVGRSETISDRWIALRQFISSWYELAIPETDVSEVIAYFQRELGRELPASVRSYIAFTDAVGSVTFTRRGREVNLLLAAFRDRPTIGQSVADPTRLQLMAQAEGDIIWAVRQSDFDRADPPVTSQFLDYDDPTAQAWIDMADAGETTTGFTLRHAIEYLDPRIGFSARVERERGLAVLSEAFGNRTDWESVAIFEDDGAVAFIAPDPMKRDRTIATVQATSQERFDALPEEVRGLEPRR